MIIILLLGMVKLVCFFVFCFLFFVFFFSPPSSSFPFLSSHPPSLPPTGDDGEGTGGTDRSNIAQIFNRTVNYPLHYDAAFMWRNVYRDSRGRDARELMLDFATAGKVWRFFFLLFIPYI